MFPFIYQWNKSDSRFGGMFESDEFDQTVCFSIVSCSPWMVSSNFLASFQTCKTNRFLFIFLASSPASNSFCMAVEICRKCVQAVQSLLQSKVDNNC